MTPRTVAVDLGGTRLRVAWVAEKRQTREWRQTAVPPSDLPQTLGRFWKKKKWGPIRRLIVGSKGIWTVSERQALQHALRALAETVTVMSDVELALHTAFVPAPKTNRILIVAGTGSIALGTDKNGGLCRAGGLGPVRGDEGSGYWIGKEFLRRQHRGGKPIPLRSVPSIKTTAALAKKVIDLSDRNPLCAAIVRSAQSSLADLIVDVHRQMGNKKSVWISWGGSVMSNKRFRSGVQALAQSQGVGSQHWTAPPDSPARTAVLDPRLIPIKTPNPIPPRGIRQ